MTNNPAPGRARALPPDERRAATIKAALPLVRLHGRGVTTRQIAESAGIAEGTIFRVFDTKDELIDAVVDHAMDLTETIDQIRAVDRTASLSDRISACVTILRDRLTAVIDLMIALHKRPSHESGSDKADAAGRDQRAGHRHTHGRNNPMHAEVLAAITELLADQADALRSTPKRAAQLLWLMTFAGTNRMFSQDDPLSTEEIVDVLLHGIARDSSATAPAAAATPGTTHPATAPPTDHH